jgi:hypothetical protein
MQYIIFQISTFIKGLMTLKLELKHVATNKLIETGCVCVIPYIYLWVVNTRGCIVIKNSMCLDAQAITILCMTQHIFYIKYCSSPLTYKNVYQVMCTNHEVPRIREVQWSLQNCGPSLRNLLHVTILMPYMEVGAHIPGTFVYLF